MGSAYADSIGDIVESTGVGGIIRNNETLPNDVGSDINLYDEAATVNGRMLIEFLDEEELALTEHTRVYIDEVYYDPNPSKSKMAIRMAQGTARFASGTGNKIKKANIKVSTPTAQIAINGTDFINLKLSLILPAQYKTKLHPAFNDLFALVSKSYFRAFIDISSDIKIPL